LRSGNVHLRWEARSSFKARNAPRALSAQGLVVVADELAVLALADAILWAGAAAGYRRTRYGVGCAGAAARCDRLDARANKFVFSAIT
jgi:hypothetical protein